MTAAEQNALNDAAAQAADETGLTTIPRSAWSLEQRRNYIDHFIAIVKANPEEFSAQTISTANWINTDSLFYDHSADADLHVANLVLGAADFAATPVTVANGIIDAINGIGSGLSSVGKLLPILVPLVLVVGAISLGKSGAREAKGAFTL